MSSSSLNQQFSTLYQQHHTWIYHWLYKKMGSSADAADLAQDTFVRILARQQQLELQQPRAYLVNVAKGLMVNWLQRKEIERAYLEVLAQQPEREHPSPERQILIIETLTEIVELLAELPDTVRLTFLYAQLEQLKYQDIADRLGISVSTVKRNIQRAYMHCLDLMLAAEDI
ncbi:MULTISPECIES: sigma-70 family RNA polymerase sigma factor [unclassified Acinetobacter]|uniref:sigma-70 family RNA polymerase sigma factor n=1 Tax=unclassified Acinetobacter TaxID=196816 RepID=UPI00244BA816|nr:MULTISPECIES: sigma-70 family RNA polymerase sigma factor [unclassified Acinetobacter]MDH0030613.1 sigma-70 family RNA polymerase sigma factor [Acinetobacter sp. GD04021]MDH0886276.1 sigma-70 family RNA polymerase sigma factor [Acinetobacter sp. GD03873]MDH1081749.1 sigma-70 family RNA polymerase sigma factor [Acinetobacter sp. GD03983]MDH2189753.1 sigma-70 family RNA polymerase sigma factor [Acinetobacter sp. GD03645]MDH2202745.1 sigma-70 family RNA polymerase sigma factor [Acinetobacter s